MREQAKRRQTQRDRGGKIASGRISRKSQSVASPGAIGPVGGGVGESRRTIDKRGRKRVLGC